MAIAQSGSKKTGLSRDDVAELYTDVRRAMAKIKGGEVEPRKTAASGSDSDAAKAIAMEIKKAMARDGKATATSSSNGAAMQRPMTSSANVGARVSSDAQSRFADVPPPVQHARGPFIALGFVCLLGVLKLTLSGIEASGLFAVQPAMAAIATEAFRGNVGAGYSREEVRLLQSLDARRVELEEESKKLEQKAHELEVRDREFTVRSAQIKDLADKLRGDRERTEKKRDVQIEQLANVYSSMGPQEAAQLLEQLDVAIALPLIERMPEKKIGQILGLMSRERALTLTKMLSASR